MKTATSYMMLWTVLLLAIGIVDLSTTIYGLLNGSIVEANPVMLAVLKAGLPVFVLVKLSTLAAFALVMEWYRRHRSPTLAHLVTRAVAAGYILIYSVSFALVNYRYLMDELQR